MIHKTHTPIGPLFREHRLIGLAGTTKTPELTKETLKEKAGTLADLKKLIGTGTRGERVKRAQEAAKIAEKATKTEMADAEKKSVLAASREVLEDAIGQVTNELGVKDVEAVTRASLEKEKTAIEKSKKELEEIETRLAALAKKNEANKSDAEKRSESGDWKTLLAYGGAALAGGAVAKWVWDHSIGWVWDNTIGNKEKPGFLRKLARTLVVVGGSVAGSLGLRWLSNKFHWNLFSKAKELWDKYGVDKPTYYAGLVLYKAGKVEEARKIWGKRADEIIAGLEAEEKTKPEAESGKKTSDKIADQKNVLTEGEEIISGDMASRSLALQYDVAEKIDPNLNSPKPLLKDAREILALAAEKKIPMGIVFDCMDAKPNDDAPYIKLLAGIYTETANPIERIQAARLVVGFIAKFREQIERAGELSESGDVQEMPLNEALNVFTHMSGAIHDIATTLAAKSFESALEFKLPDPMTFIKGILEKREIYGDRMIEVILAPLGGGDTSKMTPTQRQEFRKACADVSGFFLSRTNVRLKSIRDVITWGEDTAQYKIASKVAEIVQSDAFLERIEQSIFISPNSTNDKDVRIVNALKNLIQEGNISLSEAFRLFYLENINKDNGILLMAQVIKILGANSYHDLAIDRYNTIGDKIISYVQDTTVSLPELNLSDAQKRELRNVGLYIKDCSVEYADRLVEDLKSFAEHHPWLTGAVAAYLGIKLVVKPSLKLKRIIQWKMICKFAEMDRNAIRALSARTGRSIQDITLARDDALRLLNKYRNFTTGIDPLHMPLYGWRVRHKAWAARKEGLSRPSASTAKIRAALNNQDEIAKLLKSGRTLSEILDQADNADEYVQIVKAFKTLNQTEQISHLRKLCTVHSVEALKTFGLADDMDDVIRAVVQLGDKRRVLLLQELLNLHAVEGRQLLRAGANPAEVERILNKLAAARAAANTRKVAGVAIAAHVSSTPPPATSVAPKPSTPPKPAAPKPAAPAAPTAAAADVARAEAPVAAAAAESGDDAVRAARQSIEALDNGALLKHAPTQLLLERNPKEAAKILRIAHKTNGLTGAKRAARYMLALAENANEARRAAMIAPEVLQLIANGKSGNPAAIARFLGRVPMQAGMTLTSDVVTNAIKSMSHWQRAGTAMRTLYFAGAALEVGTLAWDVSNLVDAKKERKEQRELLGKALNDMGLTSADGETYIGCGVEITLKEVQNTDVEEYMARVGVGVGTLGFTLLAPSLCLGPAGIVLAGVAIAAHVTIGGIADAVEQRKHQEFLMKAPHWLLAILGTQTITKQSEYSLMREYIGTMNQDIWPSTWTEVGLAVIPVAGPALFANEKGDPKVNAEIRKGLREKLLASMSYRALAYGYPELLAELPGMQQGLVDLPSESQKAQKKVASFLDTKGEFLKAGGDFERIVRPYIIMRLHGHTEGEDVTFWRTNALDITDDKGGHFTGAWLGMETPTVSQQDLERAVEEAMLYYVQHIREKKYHADVRELETQVKKEEQSLAAISTLTAEERKKKLDTYEKALRTALAETVEENKDAFYIFNRKPSELPTYPDGRTFTEHLIEDKFRSVYSAQDASSAKEAQKGWRSPTGQGNMNIGRFAEMYLRPQFRERDRIWLKENSPERGEPFSFDQLNTEMGETDQEFAKTFRQKIAPAQEVDEALKSTMDTEEELKACVERLGEKIDFHQKLDRYRRYYNTYLRRWRPGINMNVPEGSPMVKTLKMWRDRGYPRLIPQEFFTQWGARAKNRDTMLPEKTLPILQQGPRIARQLQLRRNMSLSSIPGLDLGKEGVRVYSYDGYWAEMYRIAAELDAPREGNFGMDMLLGRQMHGQTPFLPIRRSAPWNQYRDQYKATPEPILTWRTMQRTKEMGTAMGPVDLRPREEDVELERQIYIDASGKPHSLTQYALKKNTVAVTPQELEQMLQELGIFAYAPAALPKLVMGPPQAPKPMELLYPINDEFKPLREYLVKSHVLVLVDSNPMQQQLPLRIGR